MQMLVLEKDKLSAEGHIASLEDKLREHESGIAAADSARIPELEETVSNLRSKIEIRAGDYEAAAQAEGDADCACLVLEGGEAQGKVEGLTMKLREF